MCGRYNIIDDPVVHVLLDILGIDIGPLPTRLNIAPTESVPVVHLHEGKRQLSEMRWWLVPHWSNGPSQQYAMFNARSEGIEKSRAYQGPFKYRRAIIPASSFVEWKKQDGEKQPVMVQAEERALAFAGVWDYWSDGIQNILSCSIITTEATKSFGSIHSRMPVILEEENFDSWLAEETPLPKIREMLIPYGKTLIATPVSRRINNSRSKELPEPVGEAVRISDTENA
ncbi:MAG: SOS response-associated peptidase [Proteobacteria bacterium]|jgi:putative SOS response-associated peptidase YedK|nr:SOS response-associated peptidase [Porticoccaceae bacterium]MBT5559585.1 SOS response-associated peptidase [Pseudomonadota bacterium]